MCGIFTYIFKENNNDNLISEIQKNSDMLKPRGPDSSQFILGNGYYMHFYRLNIINSDSISNQPIRNKNNVLVCNGEIFNYQELKTRFNIKEDVYFTKSDCEIIIHLYEFYKNQAMNEDPLNFSYKRIIDNVYNQLDGEFSFVLHDKSDNVFFACRDNYGVRPLFYSIDGNDIILSSEMKGMNLLAKNIKQLPSNSVMITHKVIESDINVVSFYQIRNRNIFTNNLKIHNHDYNTILKNIRETFTSAVEKRLMGSREICSLLSGGLDSSLVCGILTQLLGKEKLKTFSIGIKGSTDLIYARKVADHIKSIHTEVELTEDEFLNSIEETIRIIESYDTTTVRASVGNQLIAKYISENTDCKIVFNGDYSDEVCAGYKYFKNCNNDLELDTECRRLVKDIIYFDSLRSDRSISAYGLEARVPFSDKNFIEYYANIDPNLKTSHDRIEKFILRDAFNTNENDECIIPLEVLWRKKEAFSDGVSSIERSWHHIIKEYMDKQMTDEYFNVNRVKYVHNTPETKEQLYYREIFCKYYGDNNSNVIPYFWMPKWCDSKLNDPSAREI
jgi:asparagine synthase (glutamine-hydrolysing)